MLRGLSLATVIGLTSHGLASDPLPVRSGRSASLAFLRFAPRSHTLGSDESRVSYSLLVANEFHRMGPVDEDAETWRLGFEYERSIGERLSWSFEAPLIARGGGVMDAVIDWWHDDVLGDPNPVRSATRRGRAHVEFPGAEPFGSAVGVGDVTIGLARTVGKDSIGRFAVKLPTGNPAMLTGSGGLDVGAALDVTVPLSRRVRLDVIGAYVIQGRAPRLGDVRRGVYSSAIGLSLDTNSKDSWTLQWNTEQSPTKTGDAYLDSDHRVVSIGVTHKSGKHTVLQLYFSEDGDFRWFRFPGGALVGPDVTFGARLTRILK